MKLEELNGETLTHIDVAKEHGEDQILLTTESGREIRIYHEQDCCETVRIVDTEGEWHDLIGKPILEATKEEEQRETEDYESETKTALTFRVDGATVISRWIGESNGYYSESVDIREITKTS